MKRFHLFEFEDLSWFPDVIRQGMTDNLKFIMENLKVYESFVPLLNAMLEKTNSHQILDICSGGGGGIENVYRKLRKIKPGIKITLTDKFPNTDAFKYIHSKYPDINYIGSAVDAGDIPQELKGVRTIFTSFHHFQPGLARKIIKDAVDKKTGIGIFEGSERSVFGIIAVLLFVPLLSLLMTPFMRPFKWSRILFTYLIPLIPICTVWDGIVSFLRLYKTSELLQMAKAASPEGNYYWESGKVNHLPGIKLLYLIGYPLKA